MPVTLINPFVVPAEFENEFVRYWRTLTETISQKPGFIETHLYRNTGEVDQTFQFVNIALWESVEAYKAALGDNPSENNQNADKGVRFYSGLFTSGVDVNRGRDAVTGAWEARPSTAEYRSPPRAPRPRRSSGARRGGQGGARSVIRPAVLPAIRFA